MGQKIQYLISSEILNEEAGIINKYRYELDAEGYVTKVYLQENYGTVETEEKLLFEVKYK